MFPSLFTPNASSHLDDRTLQKLSELSGSCDDLLYKNYFNFYQLKTEAKREKREAFQEYWSYIVQSESSLTKSCLFFLRNQ